MKKQFDTFGKTQTEIKQHLKRTRKTRVQETCKNHSAYLVALESNNIKEAIRLANIIDWIAIAPTITPKAIDTIAADNATKTNSIEGSILRRQEKLTFTF